MQMCTSLAMECKIRQFGKWRLRLKGENQIGERKKLGKEIQGDTNGGVRVNAILTG